MPIDRPILDDWKDRLASANSRNCTFQHHALLADEEDLPLCPPEIQNTMHGCAHAAHYVLRTVISEMLHQGLLNDREANNFYNQINHGQQLFSLDQRRASEELTQMDLHGMCDQQLLIIRAREKVTAALLEIVQTALIS